MSVPPFSTRPPDTCWLIMRCPLLVDQLLSEPIKLIYSLYSTFYQTLPLLGKQLNCNAVDAYNDNSL